MGLDPGHAFIETYIALVAYIVLHQIYVIAGDFIEAFNIPPLNIGIYIDKLASVRALLMAIADILEWGITQKGFGDPGSFKKLEDKGAARRHGSVMSFIAMLICRFYYMWVVYYSDNKSLVAFITLSVEGFWFGVFQMGFFAIGPEYNAFTSFALHLTGNFVFFFQMILDSAAETRPHINCLYKVRVHGWISVVTTFIALPLWLFFCHDYIQGQSDEFQALVGDLKNVEVSNAEEIAKKLAQQMETSNTQVINLVKKEFGLTVISVQPSENNITVRISGGGEGNTDSQNPITVKVAGGSGEGEFQELVKALKGPVGTHLQSGLTGGPEIAQKLVAVLNEVKNNELKELVKSMVDTAQQSEVQNVNVTNQDSTVIVKVNNQEGNTGQATVSVTGGSRTETITIEVKGSSTIINQDKCKAIANALVLALVSDKVKQASGGKIQPLGTDQITITVEKAKSDSQAKRIAYKLGKALCDDAVKKRTGAFGMYQDTIYGIWTNVLSPFLLFPLGSFFKDFIYPGILPYAFLDSEKANFINYTMPILYMCGPIYILLVNDVFHPTGFAKGHGDSWFKDWSEGEGNGRYYHYMWLLHIPMFTVYLISLFAIHGIYPSLRVIVQSQWRVFLLTLVVLVPRSHLEVMDYVGVANYAIFAGDTGDYEGFTILSWNDMLSMFCRFCNGKLAVGYNWTRVSLGYDFQRDTANFHGFQSRKPCLSVKNPSMSVFDHDQIFVNF